MKLNSIISKARFPSNPTVIAELYTKLDSENTSLSDLGKHIKLDPGLAGRIMKRANNAGMGPPVAELNQALVKLGLRQLKTTILASEICRFFGSVKLPGPLITMDDFIQESVYSACCCSYLATHNKSTFYAAGLLRGLGRLAMYTAIPEKFEGIVYAAQFSGMSLPEAEQAYLGFNHANIATALLKIWKLPTNLTNLINSCFDESPKHGAAIIGQAYYMTADRFLHYYGKPEIEKEYEALIDILMHHGA